MNTEKAQKAINDLVLPNRLTRQYPASKKNIARLEELGILGMMPICEHPSVRAIGQTDANAVLAAAEQASGARFNASGEGDDTAASALYEALHEVEVNAEETQEQKVFKKPQEIRRGMRVKVNPFEYSQHLSGGAVIRPPKAKHHNGYHNVIVHDVFLDEIAGDMIDVFVGEFGDVDTVPASACEII